MRGDEKGETISKVVDSLRDVVQYVDAFVIVIKRTELRQSRSMVNMVDMYKTIFGEKFMKNVILVAGFWDYSDDHKIDRGHLTEEVWLQLQKKLFKNMPGAENLKAVY